jgi:hypothetical protein
MSSLVPKYDGAASLPAQELLDNRPAMPDWKRAYYEEIILPDEGRFLVSEMLEHICRVPPGTVEGERRVVIEGEVCVIEVPEEVWGVWWGYEARGKVGEDRGEKREKGDGRN